MTTVDELKSMHINALRHKAAHLGLTVKNSENKEQLVTRIVNFEQGLQKKEKPKEPEVIVKEVKEKPKVDFSELEDALQPYIQKGLRLSKLKGNCYMMEYKNKQDSGTLFQPLRTIVNRATVLRS